jgi:hypothetical protein
VRDLRDTLPSKRTVSVILIGSSHARPSDRGNMKVTGLSGYKGRKLSELMANFMFCSYIFVVDIFKSELMREKLAVVNCNLGTITVFIMTQQEKPPIIM